MYDVVKNDPNYAKNNFKGNASAIRHIINDNNGGGQQGEFRNYNDSDRDSSVEDK